MRELEPTYIAEPIVRGLMSAGWPSMLVFGLNWRANPCPRKTTAPSAWSRSGAGTPASRRSGTPGPVGRWSGERLDSPRIQLPRCSPGASRQPGNAARHPTGNNSRSSAPRRSVSHRQASGMRTSGLLPARRQGGCRARSTRAAAERAASPPRLTDRARGKPGRTQRHSAIIASTRASCQEPRPRGSFRNTGSGE